MRPLKGERVVWPRKNSLFLSLVDKFLLHKFVKSRKGAWLGGSSADFHTPIF